MKIVLKKGEQDRLEAGHLWVYDNEIAAVETGLGDGDIVDVAAANGHFLGRGYYNSRSKIAVRLLTRLPEEINEDFFRKRLREAWDYRCALGFEDSCRVVFGEADRLPALIVDKFGEYLSVQTLALGIDRRLELLVRLLDELLSPKGIYERNDVPIREKEGLSQRRGFLKGPFDPIVEIRENGARMLVDIENGQKTGYFLDQRENRAAIRPYVKDARVLDTFCHTGGFAVHAGLYGAKSVEAVDISDTALALAKRNASLNGLENVISTVEANVFDLLREYEGRGEQYDTVILDPPAFCKSKSTLPGAWRGYKEINLRGMKLVRPGGFLVTCSCSHYMTQELFLQMLREAASDCRRDVRIVELRTQSRDHPAPLYESESVYLKCVILKVY